MAPLLSFVSDAFQARRTLLFSTTIVAFVGAAIAPGSKSIYSLIVAQTLLGFGFASSALAYAVPSEILPRKWRPSMLFLLIVSQE
jgi:MFS family permease